MIKALELSKREAPTWVQSIFEEVSLRKKETACFAMYCYWTGERAFATLPGVMKTRIGILGGYEVVEFDYDPLKLTYETIVQNAKKFDCTHQVFARSNEHYDVAIKFVKKSKVQKTTKLIDDSTQQKYTLYHYPYFYYVPMTERQALKLNAYLKDSKKIKDILSPTQIDLARQLQDLPKERIKEIKKLDAGVGTVESILKKFSTLNELLHK